MDFKREAALRAYEQCFAEKHHYDKLSWTIGAVIFAASGFLSAPIALRLKSLPETKPDYFSLLAAAVAILLLWFWKSLYRRNRLWGEAANERARDIEKEFGIDGVAHAMMDAGRNGFVLLKNTDFNGVRIDGTESRREPGSSKISSMHVTIDRAVTFLQCLIFGAALAPIALSLLGTVAPTP